MRILQEIVVRLNDTRPVGVPEFELLKTLPTDAASHPACTVYPFRETDEPASDRKSPLTKRTMRAMIEVRVGDTDPLTVADPILVWITSKLNGVRLSTVADPRLSHEILEREAQWKLAPREKAYMAVFVELEIPYTTNAHNQELVS